MRAEVERPVAGRGARLRPLHGALGRAVPGSGSSSSARCRSGASPTCCASPPTCCGSAGIAASTASRSPRCSRDRAPAHGVPSTRSSSAARRSGRARLYCLIAAGAALGRAFGARRHRRACERDGATDRGPGRRGALRRRGRAHPGDERHRAGRGFGRRHGDPRRCRGVERRFGRDGAPPAAAGGAGWRERRLDRAHSSMGLFVWYFRHAADLSGARPPHDPARPRYRGLLDDIFSRKVLAEDMSLTCTARPRPTRASRRRAMTRSTCWPPCRTSPAAGLGAARRTVPAVRRRAPRSDRAARPVGSPRHLPGDDAAGFLRRFSAFRGSGFGLEPILTQSAYFRPHNRCSAVRHLYLVGAGTHPGAGLPGVLSSSKILDRVVPDAAVFA